MVSAFLFLQGARVYPTLIGRKNFKVNETRRVRFSAEVLERLNLAVSLKDKLGGTVWKGRHLLPEWYDQQSRLYFDQPEMMQKPLLVLPPAGVAKKKLGIAVQDCKKYLATLAQKPKQVKKGPHNPNQLSSELSSKQKPTIASRKCGGTFSTADSSPPLPQRFSSRLKIRKFCQKCCLN